jgi:hypothetical protein
MVGMSLYPVGLMNKVLEVSLIGGSFRPEQINVGVLYRHFLAVEATDSIQLYAIGFFRLHQNDALMRVAQQGILGYRDPERLADNDIVGGGHEDSVTSGNVFFLSRPSRDEAVGRQWWPVRGSRGTHSAEDQ